MYINTADRLRLACLNAEQHEKTCGYWYVMTSRSGPFTAFRTREALEFFLEIHALVLDAPLPENRGEHASIRVEGCCRFASHMDPSEMPIEGRRVLKLDNARYTLGIMTQDQDGPILHFINCNSERPEYDHALSRAHEDSGHKGIMNAML